MTETFSEATPTIDDLRGARIFVLRGSSWGERVAKCIRHRGGEARIVPLLEIHFMAGPDLRDSVESWVKGEYDWLLLTSISAVRAIQASGANLLTEVPQPGTGRQPRTAAVGPSTAAAAEQFGLTVSLVPDVDFATEGLIDAFRNADEAGPSRILFPVSNLTDDRLQNALESAGHTVTRITAYETNEVAAPENFRAQLTATTPAVILVTSGSAARSLHRQLPGLPESVIVASMGRSTVRALAELDVVADVIATRQTIDGLLDAVAAYLHEQRGQQHKQKDSV